MPTMIGIHHTQVPRIGSDFQNEVVVVKDEEQQQNGV